MDFASIKAKATALARRFEGYHRRLPDGSCATYRCPAGVLTIGYGSTGKHVIEGLVIGEPTAAALLDSQMHGAACRGVSLSPVLASESTSRAAAIADFIFNLGPTAYAASTLRKRINAGDWERAVVEIKRWNRGGGRVLAGLVSRRQAEADLLV